MSWVYAIAVFLGKFLAQLIPALGTKLRRNNTVEQIGANDETQADIDNDISSSVDMHGLSMDNSDDSGTP